MLWEAFSPPDTALDSTYKPAAALAILLEPFQRHRLRSSGRELEATQMNSIPQDPSSTPPPSAIPRYSKEDNLSNTFP